MPTVILFDLSLSMSRTVSLTDSNELSTFQNLANYGLIGLLDHMSASNRLEHVCLMYFSSLWERNVYFTRDYEVVKLALANNCNTFYDQTNITNALKGANDYISEEWGNKIPVQILLITDGQPGLAGLCSLKGVKAPISAKSAANTGRQDVEETEGQPNLVKFGFPCKLHVLNMCTRSENSLHKEAHAYYRKLIMDTCSAKSTAVADDQIWYLDSYSLQSVSTMFQRLAEQFYQPFHSTLICGSLSGPVSIFPPLERYTDLNFVDLVVAEPSDQLEICGFLELSEVASPPVHSRHLVLPRRLDKEQLSHLHGLMNLAPNSTYDLSSQTCQELQDSLNSLEQDDQKQPSLCLLLHGSLKLEGMVAICKLGEPDWFGMLFSWSDSKKKSNLMLSTFKCGANSVAWLENFHMFGIPGLNSKLTNSELNRLGERKSYSQSTVVWIKQNGLHSDIQKVLRLAKKLPEKTANFYKELTKFRKAALSIGFYGIIQGMATILERECRLLPGSTHPDAAMQLTHAVSALRAPCTLESLYTPITPLKTKFTND